MSGTNYYNEDFAEYYNDWTKNRYYNYKQLAEEFSKTVKGKELLELGIGTGCLAEELIKLNYKIEGVEPSVFMIKKLNEKKLGIKVYKQDACELNTGKKYDAIFSLGAIPGCILRKIGIFFDTYIVDKNQFKQTMKKSYEHLNSNGYYMIGAQEGAHNSTKIKDIYWNESKIMGNILIKTHHYKTKTKEWKSEILTTYMWPEKEFIEMMEEVGFKTIGLNKSKT